MTCFIPLAPPWPWVTKGKESFEGTQSRSLPQAVTMRIHVSSFTTAFVCFSCLPAGENFLQHLSSAPYFLLSSSCDSERPETKTWMLKEAQADHRHEIAWNCANEEVSEFQNCRLSKILCYEKKKQRQTSTNISWSQPKTRLVHPGDSQGPLPSIHLGVRADQQIFDLRSHVFSFPTGLHEGEGCLHVGQEFLEIGILVRLVNLTFLRDCESLNPVMCFCLGDPELYKRNRKKKQKSAIFGQKDNSFQNHRPEGGIHLVTWYTSSWDTDFQHPCLSKPVLQVMREVHLVLAALDLFQRHEKL